MWKNTYDIGDRYIEMYPRMKKWINQCGACQARGYKPEMPENDERYAFKNIRHRFKCLPLNEVGLCEVCSK